MDHLRAMVLVCACVAQSAAAQQAIRPEPDPLDAAEASRLSLEALMDIEVTGVAGVEQQLLRTPAAIDVITGMDIRRSGHRTLADSLRLSPGVFVGQASSHRWAISPRGFNGLLANKTLVLMDGRRLYDPLQGGTFWDVQDTLLEDVDRIEVIRGPGPTLWGANAVNGVINVVTKSSKDTQGLFLEAGAGTPLERGFGSFRYGGQLDDNAWFRVWGKYLNRGPLEAPGPEDGNDEWDLGHGGFRTDIEGNNDAKLTFEVDSYSSFTHRERITIPVPAAIPTTEMRDFNNRVAGGHVLARAERFSARDQGWSLLTYYDYTDRDEHGFEVTRHSFEIDGRYHFTLGEAHALVAGVEYYFTSDSTRSSPTLAFDPGSHDAHTFSAFLQDTITLQADRWFAMLGCKLEHNDQTGFEVQPSVRLWYTPDDRQTFWGAVSRPVRVPSRSEQDARIVLFYADPGLFAGSPTGDIEAFLLTGDPDLGSERVLAYEAGYRNQLTDGLSLDVTAFFNQYDGLVSIPTSLIGASFTNAGSAETYGAEVSLTWRLAENWRIRGSYSYVEVDVHGPVQDNEEGFTPHSQAQVRSFLDITDRLQLNAAAYYVGEVPTSGIDDYVRLDVGVTWSVTPHFDLSVWGQNLLEPRHEEFPSLDVERGVYVVGTLRF